MAGGFWHHSDARIKNIIGLSDAAKDLIILNKLEVTNYTFKDFMEKGNRPIKKLIAQQVAEVYPQSITLSENEVPDIYEIAPIVNGWVYLDTDLKVGEIVQLIFGDQKQILSVQEINEKGFRVDSDMQGDVFVYGRQVNDFHTVDYDAISMLNVSATQELAKQVELLKKQNSQFAEALLTQAKDIRELKTVIAAQNKKINNIESADSKTTILR